MLQVRDSLSNGIVSMWPIMKTKGNSRFKSPCFKTGPSTLPTEMCVRFAWLLDHDKSKAEDAYVIVHYWDDSRMFWTNVKCGGKLYNDLHRWLICYQLLRAKMYILSGVANPAQCLWSDSKLTDWLCYLQIPLPISSITDDEHPVEVGVADSFYVDRPVPPNCE